MLFFDQIYIRLRNVITAFNPQLPQKFTRNCVPFGIALPRPQDDLDFQKIAEALHIIKVDSRLPEPIEAAHLLDDPHLSRHCARIARIASPLPIGTIW